MNIETETYDYLYSYQGIFRNATCVPIHSFAVVEKVTKCYRSIEVIVNISGQSRRAFLDLNEVLSFDSTLVSCLKSLGIGFFNKSIYFRDQLVVERISAENLAHPVHSMLNRVGINFTEWSYEKARGMTQIVAQTYSQLRELNKLYNERDEYEFETNRQVYTSYWEETFHKIGEFWSSGWTHILTVLFEYLISIATVILALVLIYYLSFSRCREKRKNQQIARLVAKELNNLSI